MLNPPWWNGNAATATTFLHSTTLSLTCGQSSKASNDNPSSTCYSQTATIDQSRSRSRWVCFTFECEVSRGRCYTRTFFYFRSISNENETKLVLFRHVLLHTPPLQSWQRIDPLVFRTEGERTTWLRRFECGMGSNHTNIILKNARAALIHCPPLPHQVPPTDVVIVEIMWDVTR
jgi:hypothetical protein